MNLYLFFSIYFIIILISRYFIYNIKIHTFFYIFTFFSLLFLFSVLRRLDIGNDTLSYKKIFDNVILLGINTNPEIERGFLFFVYLFTLFSKDYYSFIFLYSAIIYLALLFFISKYSTNKFITILLFFLLFFSAYFNLFRQILAISIAFYSFESARKGKWILFVSSFLIAFTFHSSSLIILIFPFLFSIKFNYLSTIFLFIISIIFVVQRDFIVDLFVYVSGSDFYIQTDFAISTFFNLFLAILVHFFFLLFLSDSKISNSNKKIVNFYSWASTFSLVLSLFGLHIWILNRLTLLLSIFYLNSFPLLYTYSRVNKFRSNVLLILLISIMTIYNLGILYFRPEWVTEIYYFFYFN
jgi:hypothetical protein